MIGLAVSRNLGLGPDDVGYACMPLFHSNAMFLGFHPVFHVGGRLLIRDRFSASAFAPDVLRHGVTFWNYVGEPVHYILGAVEAAYGGDEERIHRVTLTVTDSRGVSGTITKDVPVAMAAFVHSTWQLTLGYPPTVSGVVENRFTERLDEVVIRAKFYDTDGVRLTGGRIEIDDLDPGERAAFQVRAEEFMTRIFHATVEVESFTAECSPRWDVVPLHPDQR